MFEVAHVSNPTNATPPSEELPGVVDVPFADDGVLWVGLAVASIRLTAAIVRGDHAGAEVTLASLLALGCAGPLARSALARLWKR